MDIKTSNEISAEERKVEQVKRSEKHKVWCIPSYPLKIFWISAGLQRLVVEIIACCFF